MNKDLFRHMRDQIRPDPRVVAEIKERVTQAPPRRARGSLLYIGGAAAACLLVAAGVFFAGKRFAAPPPVTPAGQAGAARTTKTAVPSSTGGPETDGTPTLSATDGETSATHPTPAPAKTGTGTHHPFTDTTGSRTSTAANHSSGGDPDSTVVTQVTKAPLSPMSTETAGIEGEEVPFTLILQEKSGVGPEENSQLRLIRSYDELRALCADAGQSELWDSCLARYDEPYFKDNALVLLYVVRGSGSFRHRVDALTRRGTDLCLTVSDTALRPSGDTSSYEHTCDMAYWQTVLEVRQADVSGVERLTSYWKAWE